MLSYDDPLEDLEDEVNNAQNNADTEDQTSTSGNEDNASKTAKPIQITPTKRKLNQQKPQKGLSKHPRRRSGL